MKNLIFLILIIPFLTFSLLQPGRSIPQFKISDGNGRVLTKASFHGKVVIGFYNDRSALNKNIKFEKILNNMKYGASKSKARKIFRLGVTDATSANTFTKYFWKKNLVKVSKRRGITIYGDWNGSFKKALKIPVKESTFFIIDSSGKLAYIHSGIIPEKKYNYIKKLIKRLLRKY